MFPIYRLSVRIRYLNSVLSCISQAWLDFLTGISTYRFAGLINQRWLNSPVDQSPVTSPSQSPCIGGRSLWRWWQPTGRFARAQSCGRAGSDLTDGIEILRWVDDLHCSTWVAKCLHITHELSTSDSENRAGRAIGSMSLSQWSAAMSLSPKHTTPFSVTDILSPLDHENYKKTTIEAAIPPLTPYRNTQHPQSMTGMGGMGGMSVPVTNPYHNYVPPLSHHTGSFPSQYCQGSDLAYGDPTRHSTSSWYGTNPDPRFACKYNFVFSLRNNISWCVCVCFYDWIVHR